MSNETNGASTQDNAPEATNDAVREPNGTSESSTAAEAATPKLAEQVAQLVELQAELFHDARVVAYGTVNLARADGRVASSTMRLRSRSFRTWLARTARAANGQTVSANVIDEALTALEGVARFDRPTSPVHVRVAVHEGNIYVDIGDDTGECIEVAPAGWRIIDRTPVKFIRPGGMLPLVRPVVGASIQDLRPFVNVEDDDSFALLVAWTVASFRPGRPCPALVATGEQGAAKTTFCKVTRSLTDPNVADLRSLPRNEEDLLIAACNSHVLAFDNVSGLVPWLSDALCRLITGGGLSKRTLYSDEDETILEAIRPVLLNGIEDVADRPDLAERCIALTLPPISEHDRRDEVSYWRDFSAAAPGILGALLDGVSSALRGIDSLRIERLPRMADFARWVSAAEPGLGLPAGSILGAYERNRALVVIAALDASPVASALRRLLHQRGGGWAGTHTQLLGELGRLAPDEVVMSRAWPKTGQHLSGRLRRAATVLRHIGIAIEEGHHGRGSDKERWLTIRAVPGDQQTRSSKGARND